MRRILLPIILYVLNTNVVGISQQCRNNQCIVDGTVTTICPSGGKVYIGGYFSYAGPYTGCCVGVDTIKGSIAAAASYRIDGQVSSIISDNNGGFFIAGSFRYLNNSSCPDILHINSNGTIDASFAPDSLDGEVLSLALHNTTLFAGGRFRKAGTSDRYGLAAFNRTTGTLLTMNKNIGRSVSALCVAGSRMYIGGTSGAPDDTSGSFLAVLDLETETVRPLNYKISGNSINVIATYKNLIYIGGWFDKIDNSNYRNLAAIDTGAGLVTIWSPQPDNQIRAMKNHKGKLYTAGNFNTIVGVERGGLASFDLETGSITDWSPVKNNGQVFSFDISNDIIYFGGEFDTILGKKRSKTAAINLVNNTLLEWNIPNANGYMRALGCTGSQIIAGGDFSSVGWQKRSCLASLDTMTGTITDWAPVVKGDGYKKPVVYSLALYGTRIFAAGIFIEINGNQHNYIAGFDLSTGELSSWNPKLSYSVNNTIKAIASGNERLFITGDFFDSTTGVHSPRLLAINIPDATISSWASIADGDVKVLRAAGTSVFVGGKFQRISGTVCTNLGPIEMGSGYPALWGPGTDNSVYEINVQGTTVYVGGSFRNAGGETRKQIASLDASTGRALPWKPNLCEDSDDDAVKTIAVSGNTVFAGGYFNTVKISHRNLAAIDATSGAILDWEPSVKDGIVQSLCVYGSTLYVGGSFTSIGQTTTFPYFASFSLTNDITATHSEKQYQLQTCHKNMFKCTDRLVAFSIDRESDVSVELFSLNGKKIASLANNRMFAGKHEIYLPVNKLTTGIYSIVLRTGNDKKQVRNTFIH